VRRRSGRRRYLIWGLLVLLVLAPFVILEGPVSGWLRDLGVLDRDEQFTELYFPDRRALPVTVAAGAPISFDFAVHNVEGEATSYRWKASVSSGASAAELGHGAIRLGNGDARRIHVSGGAPAAFGRAVVRVQLVARTEAIDFPVTVVALADGAASPPG
jgi:hypothetical protein